MYGKVKVVLAIVQSYILFDLKLAYDLTTSTL